MKEDLENMLIAILNDTTDSIDITDSNGVYLLVNEAKAAKRGLHYSQMTGKYVCDFMTPEETEKILSDNRKIIETGNPIKDQIEEIHYPGGRVAWVSVSKTPYENENGEKCVISVSRDVTRRIEIEKHNFSMVTNAAHHMQSPISSIGGTLNRVIKERYGKIENESVKATLADLFKRIMGLEGIVNNYLTKSALIIGEKIPEKQELDLRVDIIDPILDVFSEAIADKEIIIDNRLGSIPAGEIKFEAVKSWITMSVYELLKNAIKYGGKEEEKVIAFGYEDYPDRIHIIVYDNGPAILEEYREEIFDQYKRIKGDLDEKGTGLGLYLVRDAMRKHGGNVWYDPKPENNSKFILMIPK